MSRIYSPNEDYNKKGYGVEFSHGVAATTDAALITRLQAMGYSIDASVDVISAYDQLPKAELVILATAMGLVTTGKTKQQLVAAIEVFVDAGILPVISVVASSGLTDLVLTLSEALYDGAVAVVDAADVKAKFTGTGVTLTSALYDATAKTITFVIASAAENDTIVYTGNTLKDSAGGLLGQLSYTAGATEWGETA